MAVKFIHCHVGMLRPLLHQYLKPRFFVEHETTVVVMDMRVIEVDKFEA